MEQVREIVREREPNLEKLVEISLKKERDTNERKNLKVLEILKTKDTLIENLQNKLVA